MILNCLHRFLLLSVFLVARYSSGQLVSCPERNGRWPDPIQCDAYIECKDGVGERKICPDGLVFAIERYMAYPCVYPPETDCTARPNRQDSQPTGECPHQFGMYGFGDSTLCARYMSCSNGKAYVLQCAEGLAFNEEHLKCDWPDQVPSCNVEAYLGFSCPPTNTFYGGPPGFDFYRAPGACDRYFICLEGKPRLLICSSGHLFDSDTNTCLPSENVTSCYRPTTPTNQGTGFQSGSGDFLSNQGGFPSNQGGFPSNQGGFPSNQGGFPSNQGGFPSNQGGFPSNQGGFPSNQGGFPSNQGGFPSNQGGFPSNQGGFPSNQGGFQSNQGGFQSNQGDFRSNQGGYQSNQQDYQTNQQGYQSNQFDSPNSYSENDYFG